MPNNHATIQGTLIAQKALRTLLAEFPVLRQITTNFAPEGILFNQSVIAHIVTATTAADVNPANGYTPTDRAQVDVPVTINKHKHHTYAINDQERTSTNINLIERYALTAAHALGKAVVDDLLALIINANFANKTTVPEANFDRTKVVAMARAMNDRNIPQVGRFMLLNPGYYANLSLDPDVSRAYANPAGSGTIASGVLPNVHGFGISEYSALPANGENLTGFAGTAESLVLATRVPAEPTVSNIPGTLTVVTEPNSGLSVLLRQWYEMKEGKEYRTMTLMYGVAKGIDTVQRLTSA